MSAIRFEFVIFVIESFIICCHRVHGISFQVTHLVFQSLPLPWESLSFTYLNSLAHYMIFDTTSPSNNVTLPMYSNLDEYGESSHPNAPQASKCLYESVPSYFFRIYHLCDLFKCEYGKIKSFWVPYPLITKFMSPSQPRELVSQ